MPGPPTDIPANELWLKLQQAPRPSVVIDFPRVGDDGKPLGRVRIQVLTMRDHDQARIAAHMWLKEKKKIPSEDIRGPSIQEVYGDAVARELLCLACLSVDPIYGSEQTGSPKYARIFPDAEMMGKRLSADEIMVLFTAYQMAQHRYGPFEGSIRTDEDLNLWMRRLVEGAADFPLAQRTWHQLVELTMWLAARAWSLSAILESQYSGLPDTLKSHLKTLGFGIGYFGKPLASITKNGPILSDQELIDHLVAVDRELKGLPPETPIDPAAHMDGPDPWADPGETLSLEQAKRIAADIYKGAEG